jgi:hypothetical protein
MGLDAIELVMECEETFGISIPDSAAAQCCTPKDLTNYIYSRIQKLNDQKCLSQIGFYQIRRILINDFGGDRKNIRPETEISSYLINDTRKAWRKLQHAIGSDHFPALTLSPITSRIIFGVLPTIIAISMSYNGFLPDELVTVMLMYYIIAGNIAFRIRRTLPKKYIQLKDFIPFVTCIKSNRWSEDAVLETVLEITARRAGLNSDQFNEYSDFIKDIGLD